MTCKDNKFDTEELGVSEPKCKYNDTVECIIDQNCEGCGYNPEDD